MADLAFIATNTSVPPAADAVVRAAATFGRHWTLASTSEPGATMSFDADGVTVVVMPIPAMHPDIPNMPTGPTAAEHDDLDDSTGHIIVTALGLSGSDIERDCELANLTAVVVDATDAVGAMLGHNMFFHRPDVFRQLVIAGATEGHPPIPILISVTVAGDGSGRMSFLSHAMDRYDREDVYITCSVEGQGAVSFVYDTITWFFDLETPLPTGDAIGRDESERIEVQRVPSPVGNDRVVIRLDLD